MAVPFKINFYLPSIRIETVFQSFHQFLDRFDHYIVIRSINLYKKKQQRPINPMCCLYQYSIWSIRTLLITIKLFTFYWRKKSKKMADDFTRKSYNCFFFIYIERHLLNNETKCREFFFGSIVNKFDYLLYFG